MESSDREMRIQIDLHAGRDDHLIEALRRVKPRQRAEHIRNLLTRQVAGSAPGNQQIELGQDGGRNKVDVAPTTASSPRSRTDGGTGSGAANGMDLAGLAEVAMEMDFSSLGKG